MQTLTIIVPSYNEEESLKKFYNTLESTMKEVNISYSYLFVDDGSHDKTLEILKELNKKDNKVNYISFSRNFGKEAALKAGLEHTKSDYAILMDADLQHPPYLIKDMVAKALEGYKIVYTKQKNREKQNAFTRFCAKAFYSVFNKFSCVDMEQSLKDYMIISKEVIEAINSCKDFNRFFRGLFSYVGFKRYALEFDYVEREEGVTKWNFKKLLKYGVNNLNQFSTIFKLLPIAGFIFSLIIFILSIILGSIGSITLDTFLILFLGSMLFGLLNITLYFMFYVIYKERDEVINRPMYFIEESSLNE